MFIGLYNHADESVGISHTYFGKHKKRTIMKTLQNQTLLYDEDCPLCQIYTVGFIKTKMLDSKGRKPFTDVSAVEQQFVDLNRATNEIALIDTKNKTVIYGVDSLLKILGNSFPWIEKIGKLKPIHFVLKKLYAFISFNRKVIIQSDTTYHQKVPCVPKFSMTYRFLYISFALIITTLVLFKFSSSVTNLPKTSIGREFLLAIGQIGFQTIFILNKKRETIINYIGNLMTVSLLGCLILLPLLIINSFFHVSDFILFYWFGTTVVVMYIEHFRRIKILKLPTYLSHTWVLFRVIALILILNLFK